jgi:hypothetical protein
MSTLPNAEITSTCFLRAFTGPSSQTRPPCLPFTLHCFDRSFPHQRAFLLQHPVVVIFCSTIKFFSHSNLSFASHKTLYKNFNITDRLTDIEYLIQSYPASTVIYAHWIPHTIVSDPPTDHFNTPASKRS